jgi:hypothetical protein
LTVKQTVVYPELLREFVANTSKMQLPFMADSNFVKKESEKEKGQILTNEEIELLAKKNLKEEDFYYVGELIKLNKMKAKGTYKKYVESLDLAMLKDATARAIGYTESGDSAVFIWCVQYSSYEACPYYAGTDFFISLIQNGKVIKTLRSGKYLSAGDPPSSMEEYGLFTIHENLMIEKRKYSYTYEDEEVVEKRKSEDIFNF